jgi:hypothetical protein
MKELTNTDLSLKQFFVPLTNAKAIIFIIIIGFIIYGNALFNGFVWDDYPFILNNTDIHSFNISTLIGPSPHFSRRVGGGAGLGRLIAAESAMEVGRVDFGAART